VVAIVESDEQAKLKEAGLQQRRKEGRAVLFYDHEARRQFANERIADLAQEARSVRMSDTEGDARGRTGFATRLLQAWPSRKHAPSGAPAFRV
jgi:hypothetical protein